MDTQFAAWLLLHTFRGREDGDEGEGGSGSEGSDGDGDEGDEGEGEGGEGEGSGDSNDVEALKRALAKERKEKREERKARRKLEREAQERKDKADKGEEDKAVQKAAEDLAKERDRTTKLAQGLLKKERDDAILNEARKQGFIDPSDALTDDIRNAVEFDQDDDDPSDIDIDLDTVKDAVKKLALAKKHLIAAPNGGEESGGRFRRGQKPPSDETKLRQQDLENYPSLR